MYDKWQQTQTKYHKLLAGLDHELAQERRRDRLPAGEQPSPAITMMLEPRRPAPTVEFLQAPGGGGTISDPRRMATVFGRYTAGIYQRQPTEDVAMTEMAAAVAAQAPAPATWDELAKTAVTQAEVRRALTRLKCNKATGLDGIAAEIYKAQPKLLVPILARVFSAINQSGRAPSGFTDGLIVYLPKKVPQPGSELSPADYRPITLLGSDYKLYSLVLTLRLQPLLAAAIPDAQSAFISDRRITDNVWLARAMHDHLRVRELEGVAVDLDIAKAYDQVSREALRRLWAALGGQQASFWLEVLCSNTRSRAYSCTSTALSPRSSSWKPGSGKDAPHPLHFT